MGKATITVRIASSAWALGISWFGGAVVAGLCFGGIEVTTGFLLWSLPFFAAGWLLVGIPIIAMGDRILRIPPLLLGAAGALAGAFVFFLFPWFVGGVISNGAVNFTGFHWSPLNAFGVLDGASGLILYSWLLSRAVRRDKARTKH